MPETETPEPTVLLTGISGATYKVLADIAIEAVPDGDGSRITDRWRRSVLLTDGKEVSAGIDAISVQQSPIECRRLGYQAKGYVILHGYLGNEQVAVPSSVLHTRVSMVEFSGNPSRIYATAEEPMVRLHDKQTFTGLNVRETAEEIDALFPETLNTEDKATAYRAKDYVILHTCYNLAEVAVPISIARNRIGMSGVPARIYAPPEKPIIRLADEKELVGGHLVRETREEIDELLFDTGDKAQDLLRALTNASAAAASAHSAYLKAKAEFVAAAEALAAAAKAMEDLQL